MDDLINHRDGRSAVLTGLGLAVVWAVAAAVRPTTTFHLAPVLVAGAVPFLAGRWRPPLGILAAVVGAAIATATAIALGLFDLLQGPSLLPYGGALLEALVFALIGSVAGAVTARTGASPAARERWASRG